MDVLPSKSVCHNAMTILSLGGLDPYRALVPIRIHPRIHLHPLAINAQLALESNKHERWLVMTHGLAFHSEASVRRHKHRTPKPHKTKPRHCLTRPSELRYSKKHQAGVRRMEPTTSLRARGDQCVVWLRTRPACKAPDHCCPSSLKMPASKLPAVLRPQPRNESPVRHSKTSIEIHRRSNRGLWPMWRGPNPEDTMPAPLRSSTPCGQPDVADHTREMAFCRQVCLAMVLPPPSKYGGKACEGKRLSPGSISRSLDSGPSQRADEPSPHSGHPTDMPRSPLRVLPSIDRDTRRASAAHKNTAMLPTPVRLPANQVRGRRSSSSQRQRAPRAT